MALIVEDGTGKVDAESYDAVANITAYLAKYSPSAAWVALGEPAQEDFARQATQYLDIEYGERYDGDRLQAQSLQALDWPRMNAFFKEWQIESSEIPLVLMQAEAELCKLLAEGETLVATANANEDSKTSERVKVGPIEIEDRWASGKDDDATKTFDKVEALLAPIVRGAGSMERG